MYNNLTDSCVVTSFSTFLVWSVTKFFKNLEEAQNIPELSDVGRSFEKEVLSMLWYSFRTLRFRESALFEYFQTTANFCFYALWAPQGRLKAVSCTIQPSNFFKKSTTKFGAASSISILLHPSFHHLTCKTVEIQNFCLGYAFRLAEIW